jgi:hypothetical protein
MKKTKSIWLIISAIVGIGLDLTIHYFSAGSPFLSTLILLFVLLIGIAWWFKTRPGKPN